MDGEGTAGMSVNEGERGKCHFFHLIIYYLTIRKTFSFWGGKDKAVSAISQTKVARFAHFYKKRVDYLPSRPQKEIVDSSFSVLGECSSVLLAVF